MPHGAHGAPAPGTVSVRPMTLADVEAVLEMERAAFPDIPDERLWTAEQVRAHLTRFPDGQFVAESQGRVLGSAMNMLTTWERATRPHTWRQMTARGSLSTHLPDGDVLYGTEVMVHPDARRMGVGRRLFEARYAHVRERGLRAFVTGGRLPGYGALATEMTAWEYVERVMRDELTDPVLTPELKWGLTPLGILGAYMFDPPSLHHATLVVWENPEPTRERESRGDALS